MFFIIPIIEREVLGTAETEIAEKLAKASEQYVNNPMALQLWDMNMLFEGLKGKASLIFVPSWALYINEYWGFDRKGLFG